MLITATLLSFLKVNLHKLHCFLLLSNLLGFLQLKKTLHDFFSSNLVKLDLDLDPDPHSEKLMDPDLHKMNADPQPCMLIANQCSGSGLDPDLIGSLDPDPDWGSGSGSGSRRHKKDHFQQKRCKKIRNDITKQLKIAAKTLFSMIMMFFWVHIFLK